MRSVRDKNGPQIRRGGGLNTSLRRLFKPPLGVWGFLIFFSISTASAQDVKLPPRPDPPRLVNDMAGMLSPDEVSTLEHKLTAYDDSTSTQVAVVVIPSLDGADIAEYATELATAWGIGKKGKDNGVLLLVSKNERKVFIATGRGVEASLPDVIVKRIIDHDIRPQFKAGQYYAGISAAVDEMIARLSGQFTGDEKDNTGRGIHSSKWIALIIVLIFLFILFGRGGGGQTMTGSGSSAGLWFLLGSMLGGMGGRGGGYGGDGGGGGGGGFGGFGGGDFGGGGAGGDW